MPKSIVFIFILFLLGCESHDTIGTNISIDDVAGNEEIKRYMEAFEGRGIMSDSTELAAPAKALENFQFVEDLKMDLLLSEPQVHQPVELNFDHRGRLWVVMYNQYPYPKGLKVVDLDHHLRAVFDKKPEPPGKGIKGADKIVIFEDTNGDGVYDKSTDAIEGLNIATSVTLGRGKIWVLTPPYLVAYPDPDGDGIPDGDPVVHLDGFGLEDTHAVANSLRWGPDGWLYGAQGSTATATVNSGASKDVHFKGQAIWRYHPETAIFEVYGEGGGNTFHVEIDAKGRVFSGDNGTSRGFFYKQGGYYKKNWGKHGALTNPYALGYLSGMKLEGKKIRFTHAWVKYEGGSLPEDYNNKIIAINPLLNYIQLSRLENDGSTFTTIDEKKILETEDHWFRPVDIKVGPDGSIYLADWHDSRLSHVDPRDNWNKSTGRIYRFRNKEKNTLAPFDLSTYSNSALIALLGHDNKWFRQQALRQFGDRKDQTVLPELEKLLDSDDPQLCLEALWAINLSDAFDDENAIKTLKHQDPFVRLWSAQLIGNKRKSTSKVADELIKICQQESHPEVIGQLASTAKRLSGNAAIKMIENLLRNPHIDAKDLDNNMLIWWAIESKTESDRELILHLFEQSGLWNIPIVEQTILDRLIRRYALAGGRANYQSCQRLLEIAPDEKNKKIIMAGLQEGLRGRNISTLPVELTTIMSQYQKQFGNGKLTLAIQQGDQSAIDAALTIILDKKINKLERLAYTTVFGEVDVPESVPTLLEIVHDAQFSDGIRLAALKSLGHYDDEIIGEKIATSYPFRLQASDDVRDGIFNLLVSRVAWGKHFLKKFENAKEINKAEIPLNIVRQLKLLNDEEIQLNVDVLWPDVKVTSTKEKQSEILRIKHALESGTGEANNGKLIYSRSCGTCHRLHDEGGILGPDLTGYDRSNINYFALNIVDPSADIREGYVTYVVTKNDRQSIVGTMVGRNGDNITIKPFSGDEVTIYKDQIQEVTTEKTSSMPERLTEQLSEQEIKDLFAYLMQT